MQFAAVSEHLAAIVSATQFVLTVEHILRILNCNLLPDENNPDTLGAVS